MNMLRASIVFVVGCSTSAGPTAGETTAAVTTSDRAYLQSLLDAGGEVVIPAGNYVVDQAGTTPYCLTVRSAHVHGAGQGLTTITLASGTAGSVSIFHLTGDGARLDDLTLDGNKANQTDDQGHRHGVFTQDGTGIRIARITAQNFTGDGVYFYSGLTDVTLSDSTLQGNARNGVTMGAQQTGVTISGNQITGNAAQPVDSEPVYPNVVSQVTVVNNTIQAAPGQYAVTVSGNSSTNPGKQWAVTHNAITGGVLVVWASTVAISDNTITSADLPPVTIQRSSSDVVLLRNTLSQTGPTGALSGVYVVGTSAANMPSKVSILDNQISVASPQGFGVRADGVSDATVTGNTITGSVMPSAGSAGVRFRATLLDQHQIRGVVTDNAISGFDYGIAAAGNTENGIKAVLEELDVVRNTITGPHGVTLDTVNAVPSSLYVRGNQWSGVATPHIVNVPATCTIIASDE